MESKNTPPPQLRNTKIEQTLHLPEEIIEEILSRVPVKSLLKFRCVSKSWRSLIRSKRFIKNHLQNSKKNTSFAHHWIILNSSFPLERRLEECSLHSLLNETFTDSFTIDDSMRIDLVGCCNGLVCILVGRQDFILWNPSTRMSKKLPDIRDKLYWHFMKYGFGCDESSGDYKVFVVLRGLWKTGRGRAISKLYSLNTNSWKIMSRDVSSPNARMKFSMVKFTCGKLHWEGASASDWDIISDRDIISFDLKSEVFGMVEQPCFSKGFSHRSLGVLGGCLCLLYEYPQNYFDIWVMKQYGVRVLG